MVFEVFRFGRLAEQRGSHASLMLVDVQGGRGKRLNI